LKFTDRFALVFEFRAAARRPLALSFLEILFHSANSEGQRTLQVDAVVFNKNTGTLGAYEVKRGAGLHDSGKRRSMLKDALCIQVLLKHYAKQRGYDPKSAESHFIFFYGKCSIPRPFAITGAEMDQHFSWPVYESVDEVNKYFQSRLFSILAGAR
jgi:hypothetical protein